MPTSHSLAHYLEEFRWRSRTKPWAQLGQFAYGCLFVSVTPHLSWLQIVILFASLMITQHLIDRATRFSERLQTRIKIERDLRRRYESYVLKNFLWFALGLCAFLMASGELNHNFAPLFYLPAPGLIGQLIWMRKGINEETYQLPE